MQAGLSVHAGGPTTATVQGHLDSTGPAGTATDTGIQSESCFVPAELSGDRCSGRDMQLYRSHKFA